MPPPRAPLPRAQTCNSLCDLSSVDMPPVKRFDGTKRTSAIWDGLRKDDELWSDEYDCQVHLYARGASQRGPSIHIPLAALERAKSPYLLDKCLHRILDPSSPAISENANADSGYESISGDWTEKYCQLFIPAPSGFSKEEAFSYHLSTRNYFAYILCKPVVGLKLGRALAELWQRVQQWSPAITRTEFLRYCEEQGYASIVEDPNYALAMLYFSEEAQLRLQWTNAFVHCVGMHELLEHSAEYEDQSNTTKALITRASLEMDLHIDRVVGALRWFLEEELGQEYLGLSNDARQHLDRFRSFLQSHYVDKAGYFPPSENEPWNKRLWFGMYNDFHNLYEYLADKDSSMDRMNSPGVSGGVCVEQNIQAFDERHGYVPLPHPLPILPELPARRRTVDAQKTLRGLRMGKSEDSLEPRWSASTALREATNTDDQSILGNSLVYEYVRFERAKVVEKINIAEARKIRWLLIYSVLQMIISITRAPKDVSDTETASYPLCVLTTNCPPWIKDAQDAEEASLDLSRCSAEMLAVKQSMEADRISIHPDCEADNAEDFFSKSLSRSGSNMSLNMYSAPVRTATQTSRTASLKSSVHSLHRSMVGSLSRRGGSRRNSILGAPRKEPGFCEILVQGYGNGADDSRDISPREIVGQQDFADLDTSQQQILEPEEINEQDTASNGSAERVLEFDQLHLPLRGPSAEPDDHSPTDSQQSAASSYVGASGRSSYLDECVSPASSVSCWMEHDTEPQPQPQKVDPSLSAFDFDFPKSSRTTITTTTSTSSRHHTPEQHRLRRVNVNAGCYTPTGATGLSRFSSLTSEQRVLSSASIASMASAASSVYAEEGTQKQAAEIEEEDGRGRRRSRALDRLGLFKLRGRSRRMSII